MVSAGRSWELLLWYMLLLPLLLRVALWLLWWRTSRMRPIGLFLWMALGHRTLPNIQTARSLVLINLTVIIVEFL